MLLQCVLLTWPSITYALRNWSTVVLLYKNIIMIPIVLPSNCFLGNVSYHGWLLLWLYVKFSIKWFSEHLMYHHFSVQIWSRPTQDSHENKMLVPCNVLPNVFLPQFTGRNTYNNDVRACTMTSFRQANKVYCKVSLQKICLTFYLYKQATLS